MGYQNDVKEHVGRLLADVPIDFGGGCSVSKAYLLASLIRNCRMTSSLDIGVYRGRSLLPQAWAQAKHTGGIAYGVDPWTSQDAIVHDRPDLAVQMSRWAEGTDFELVFQDLTRQLDDNKLQEHCQLVRMTSREAADRFRSEGVTFDLIHVDGNHDAAIVGADADDYLPLLRKGGVMVMDDVSWDSVKPACARITARMALLLRRHDQENDYAVFADLSGSAMVPPSVGELLVDEFVVRG